MKFTFVCTSKRGTDRASIFARKRATESLGTGLPVLFWLEVVGGVRNNGNEDIDCGTPVFNDTDGNDTDGILVKSPLLYVDAGKNSDTLSPEFGMVFILGVINGDMLSYNGKDRGIDCSEPLIFEADGRADCGKFVILGANGNGSEADG